MWSKAQTSAFQKAIAAADKNQKAIDGLLLIANVSPIFADSVRDLLTLHEHTRVLAETALQAAVQSLTDSPA